MTKRAAAASGINTDVAVEEFVSYAVSIPRALDAIEAGALLASGQRVVLKPNLVNHSPHPITTPPACIEALIDYIRRYSAAEIVVAEGSGDGNTRRAFRELGYEAMASRKGAELIDLDAQPFERLTNPRMRLLKEFYLPRTVLDCLLISVPVLKAHSMAKVTLAMKNLFGIAPARVYSGSAYKKARLHGQNNDELQRYIFELNQYRKPDLSVIDATIGMANAHLWGPHCDPPVNKILASADPVAIDARGAELLGLDWRGIDHIRMANGVLGRAEPAS
ncbi:MAG: DUF362 domain-containing protein [Candidatus Hydrogenedentales bacterium]|jgi:uncharacterized protein (DUF362 family)